MNYLTMNSPIAFLSSLPDRLYGYAIDLAQNKETLIHLMIFLKQFPEILDYQYVDGKGHWHDTAWDIVNGCDPIKLLTELHEINYKPSLMFRERIIARADISLLKHYLALYEPDTAQPYVISHSLSNCSLVNRFAGSSILNLWITLSDILSCSMDDKRRISVELFSKASKNVLNGSYDKNDLIAGLYASNFFASQVLLVANFLSGGIDLGGVYQCRGRSVIDFAQLYGLDIGDSETIIGDEKLPHQYVTLSLHDHIYFKLCDDLKLSFKIAPRIELYKRTKYLFEPYINRGFDLTSKIDEYFDHVLDEHLQNC